MPFKGYALTAHPLRTDVNEEGGVLLILTAYSSPAFEFATICAGVVRTAVSERMFLGIPHGSSDPLKSTNYPWQLWCQRKYGAQPRLGVRIACSGGFENGLMCGVGVKHHMQEG